MFITTIATALPDLEWEHKIAAPTRELWQALQRESAGLYQEIRDQAIELHREAAHSTLQLYQHPLQTLSFWRGRLSHEADNALLVLNEKILPEALSAYRQTLAALDSEYRQAVAGIGEAGAKTRDFIDVFAAHPLQTSEQVYARLAERLQILEAGAMDLYRQSAAEAEASLQEALMALQQLYHSSLASIELFADAPSATAAVLYYQLSAALLDFYAQGVGVMLEVLDTAPMPGGWAL